MDSAGRAARRRIPRKGRTPLASVDAPLQASVQATQWPGISRDFGPL